MSATGQRGMSRTSWIVTLGAVVVLAAVIIGGYAYMSTPRFCDSCHIMNTRYVSWHRSAHWDKATCLDCHADPGFVGGLRAHIGGARYLWAIVTGKLSSQVLRADTADVSCLECHTDPDVMDQTTKGHVVAHENHKDAGVGCVSCHDNLVHGTLTGEPTKRPMQSCTGCHGMFDQAADSCRTCHPAPGFARSVGTVTPARDFSSDVAPVFNRTFAPQ